MNIIKKSQNNKPAFYTTTLGGRYEPTVGQIASKHQLVIAQDKEVRSWLTKKSPKNGLKLKMKSNA